MTTEEVDSQNGQNEYNFLVVGPIGAGKSTFCNLITGDEVCYSSNIRRCFITAI